MLRAVYACSIALIASLFHVLPTAAASLLPAQGDICSAIPPPGQLTAVSKRLVANYVLAGNATAIKRVFGDPVLWNSIFTMGEDQFCATSSVCRGVTGDACKKEVDACKLSRASALMGAETLLDGLAADSSSKNPSFSMSPALVRFDSAARMRAYFSTAADNGIECVAPKSGKMPQSPAVADTSPLRVRGLSNDLLTDRSAPSFSSTSQATLTATGDHSTPTQTQNFKATGAIGYAFQGDLATAVPYVSFNQSITDVTGKPVTTDPSSFVAGGMMFTGTIPGDVLVQTIAAKPQFLENTKNYSQIGSLTLVYKPFTGFDVSNGGFNLNDPRPLPFWPSVYGEVLFDLRSDIGQYLDRGNDSVQRLLNQNYVRAGTYFGFSLTTDPSGPSFTLTVAETYLHGFTGSVRNLDLFHTQLTYNFDAKKYVGITVAYTKGRNEDTALPTQTWTVGLSAKY
ncbi:MAG: hypothetical protein NTAFB05_19830 [Nitrobacter sp.]|uniref:hypothetical protein n=1 Tax=Nitrobacter sp. TaxID=29420 RepID=UPI00387DFA87